MHKISLITRDGARLSFPCEPGKTVLDAAADSNLFLPSMCLEGHCGRCHAQVTAGAYEMGSFTPEALPDADHGGVLLCRCKPLEALTIALPFPESDILRHEAARREAVIEEISPAGAGAMTLGLRLKADPVYGQAADFIPGQYMELTLPGTETVRAYSLTNLPNWDGKLEFLIRLQKDGAFSTWLSQRATVGETLNVRGPLGSFVLDETSIRPRCLIGGGCGFAPVLSMLRHLADFQDNQPTHLIFGANQEDELFPAQEIEGLSTALPQLSVTLSVWHPSPEWRGFRGTAADALADYLARGGETPDIYVCGPPKLVESVKEVALAHGLDAARVMTERVA
jgi:NAD(P)H-flavin reductase/ferredoxin